MGSIFWGELLGTATLILLGNGVVACVLLTNSKGHNSGWIVITAGWAFAVMCGVFVAAATGSPAAYLNPAVAVGLMVDHGGWSKLPIVLAGDFAGAFIGATLVWLHFLPHWRATEDRGLKLACFCTAPAIRNTAANLLSEVIGTFVLVFVVGAIFSKTASANGVAGGVGPYLVGSLVWGIGLSLGGTTGYAINPARDLGPRIAHALLPIAGKGSADWSYAPIPVVGPLVGGALAGVVLAAFGI
ncbi:MIP/aquaporin family protein [Acidocella sp.]|uniref:MIP/aquaporin family protein n=1 Tax=Acidocella sp. TaxID=50710 RepID=UPI0018236EBC|nr:MIP/aquaporin family protein [Acidocella sp.]NNM55625.1 aquaporin family protein [Acidocella sp.]